MQTEHDRDGTEGDYAGDCSVALSTVLGGRRTPIGGGGCVRSWFRVVCRVWGSCVGGKGRGCRGARSAVAVQNMVVSVRVAAGTSSASMYAMSWGGARSRDRSPAAECDDNRSSRSSSVDLNARTTRSCNQHNPPLCALYDVRRPRHAPRHTLAAPVYSSICRLSIECGVDVLFGYDNETYVNSRLYSESSPRVCI